MNAFFAASAVICPSVFLHIAVVTVVLKRTVLPNGILLHRRKVVRPAHTIAPIGEDLWLESRSNTTSTIVLAKSGQPAFVTVKVLHLLFEATFINRFDSDSPKIGEY